MTLLRATIAFRWWMLDVLSSMPLATSCPYKTQRTLVAIKQYVVLQQHSVWQISNSSREDAEADLFSCCCCYCVHLSAPCHQPLNSDIVSWVKLPWATLQFGSCLTMFATLALIACGKAPLSCINNKITQNCNWSRQLKSTRNSAIITSAPVSELHRTLQHCEAGILGRWWQTHRVKSSRERWWQ